MLTRSYLAIPTVNFLLLLCCLTSCHAQNTLSCLPSSCGNLPNISFPFRLKSDPKNCGDHRYELECQNNKTILNLNSVKYHVQSIDYDGYTIRLLDPAADNNNPCSFPLNSPNYTQDTVSISVYTQYTYLNIPLIFINCLTPVNSSTYVDITVCTSERNSSTSLIPSGIRSYIVAGDGLTLLDLEESCSVEKVISVVRSDSTNYTSLSSIHKAVATGFELWWYYSLCSDCRGECRIEHNSLSCQPYKYCYEDVPLSQLSFRCHWEYWAPFIIFFGAVPVAGILGLRFICGFLCFIALLVYKEKRRKSRSEWGNVQDLIKGLNHLKPIQYSYSEIKKMTDNFKEKLGVGSHGDIFRGKLRSGPAVAVKIMDKPKANAEEFLSVVAAVGRVGHVNVMQLIGFCIEGKKRALVYDFMPNGSIQKYISPREGESVSLSCESLYGISLGVARGIDHLHRNCDFRAAHLGFRPHNVLLDEQLIPKISDFGLAKLCPGLSYVAPEFYYKNGGEVTHKADVYGFGMLLVEMISRLRILNSLANTESPISSSSWMYGQLVEGNEVVEHGDASAEEKTMIKKMINVASWCIQMKPADRPCMGEVVKMLEEDDDAD